MWWTMSVHVMVGDTVDERGGRSVYVCWWVIRWMSVVEYQCTCDGG